ncbi:hypothetical protein COT75_01615 [Candidatus Beckwithbacteria bacterium CG10_big_fil_rev_8_21_14_0_10_34_10]|uniref:Methyltransferase type 11 domain-containing protein n=1 Tax=Candidatus Beckwithbacteria bacterium CG10_big_fil_rev_8_21_14_0_10_34_10 TaxID=1974495 RepID=A0A2H0W9W9_9BACT|nr:MAG: hypothetical protein COT75_01615 [Candidatus Beckwithbacteria bacterium CG10_big_fil_rev_8_21_14_0_10_34_10]
MFKVLFPFVWFLKKSKNLSALSCRLTQLTGKSKYPIHPKHLVKKRQSWYLKDIKKTDLVLDIGCGNGQNTLKTAKRCLKVIGVDYDQNELQIAKKTILDGRIKNTKILHLNLEKKLPFKNSYFDKVLCLDVLEHLNKRNQLLKEIKRVMKKKGEVFISIPNKNTSWKKIQKRFGLNFYSDSDHKTEYSQKGIKKILEDYGFKILKIEPVVYDTSWAGFIDLIGGFSLPLYQRLLKWKQDKLKSNFKESIGFRIKVQRK